jgi:preprotein translocase subunit SecA
MRMIEMVKEETVSTLMRVHVVQEDEVERLEEEHRRRQAQEMQLNMGAAGVKESENVPQQPVKREIDKIGRNADCPCGSGQKYKKCCGRPQ